MNTRRDILRSFALVPVAAVANLIPKYNDIQVPQSAKSFIERAKYLDYTEQDFMACRLVLRDEAGNKRQTRLFNSAVVTKDPLKCVMRVGYSPVGLKVVSAQFMDKDRRCLFTPKRMYVPEIPMGNTFKLTYTIRLD